jgi:transposase
VRATSLLKEILGLKKTRIRRVHLDGDRLVVEVALATRIPRCSGCGCRARRLYDRRGRNWRHLDVGGLMVVLHYDLRRVDCRRCGVTTEMVPWAETGSWFTREFEQLVGYLAQNANKTVVATLMRVAWATVGSIVGRVVKRLGPADALDDLREIGIDELSYRKHHEYLTIVVDHRHGRIVWARPGKNAATLKAFFDELGPERCAKLQRVSIDMSAAYEKAVRDAAPAAEVVFDRFHVQRLVHDALDQVRRAEVRELEDPVAKRALKNTRWALQKRPWNLTEADGTKLALVQQHNRRLYRAHLLKETLAAILDKTIGPASRKLGEWITWARRSRLAPFAKAAATIRDHMGGILAFCESGLSNARVEALNGKARTITRRSYGFHGPNPLIALLFLCCGGIHLTPPHAAVHP